MIVLTELDTSFLGQMDFSALDELLRENSATSSFHFQDMVTRLISGQGIDKQWILDQIWAVTLGEINGQKNYMIQIILLAAAFALLYNFANVFENKAVTDISFYIVYMILLVLLMKSFLLMGGLVSGTLNTLLDFMKALLPAFALALAFSGKTMTALGFYQLTLLLIYVIQGLLIYILIPAIQIYIVLELMNQLTKEELIGKLTELLRTGVSWSLKFLFALVVGINVVQGLLSPAIDSFKQTVFSRTADMLPVLGTSLGAALEVVAGSGIIIKNGVGLAGGIAVLLLCLGPMVKVGIMILLYQVTAAVIQPVADPRIAGCISGMGEGTKLLGKVIVTANVMFLVTIAIITAATGR